MVKSGILAAAVLAVSMLMPAGTSPAEALTGVKPAVKDGSLKHEVGRRGFRRGGFRGFRRGGLRGFRRGGFRRGFRRGRIGGLRLRIGRGYRGRRFYGGYYPRRRWRRRFYRPRYYGVPYVSYRYARGGRCWRLRRTAIITGKSKWWRRYHRCRHGYYGW